MNIPFLNDIDLKNNKIINLANPTADSDASNKIYVDTKISEVLASVDTSLGTLETRLQTSITQSASDLTTYIDNEIDTLDTSLQTFVNNKIVDDLNTNDNTKVLAASQGYVINNRLVALEVISNNYNTDSTYIGSFFTNPLNRFVVNEIYNTQTNPLTNPMITIVLSNLALNEIPVNIYGFAVTDNGSGIPNGKVFYISHCGYNSSSLPDGISISSYNRETQELGLWIGQTVYADLLGTGNTLKVFLIIEYTDDSILV